MRKHNKQRKSFILAIIVLAMIFQLVGPVLTQNAYADEVVPTNEEIDSAVGLANAAITELDGKVVTAENKDEVIAMIAEARRLVAAWIFFPFYYQWCCLAKVYCNEHMKKPTNDSDHVERRKFQIALKF